MKLFNKIAQGKKPEASFESNVEGVVNNASTAVIEDQYEAPVVDETLAPYQDALHDVINAGNEISSTANTAGALQSLVDQTVETYGVNGMTEQGAELYRVSMEALLKTAGIDIPVDSVVPSFEDGMSYRDYSTEVVAKAGAIIKRIVEWVIKALKSFGNMLVRFKDNIKRRFSKVRDEADRVAKEAIVVEGIVETAKAAGSHEPAKTTVKLSEGQQEDLAAVDYKLGVPSLGTLGQSIEKMVAAGARLTDPVKNLPSAGPGGMTKFVEEVASAFATLKKTKIGQAHELVLTAGSDADVPTSGSKVALNFIGHKKAEIELLELDTAKALSEALAKDPGDMIALLTALETSQKMTSSLFTEANLTRAQGATKATDADIRRAALAGATGASLHAQITAKLCAMYVDTMQSMVDVCEASVKAHKAGNKEKEKEAA